MRLSKVSRAQYWWRLGPTIRANPHQVWQATYAPTMVEYEVSVGGRSVMVRDTGDVGGACVVYFHGTPGSRLEVDFGIEVAQRMGLRVISFDRPGYGRSDAAPSSLGVVAKDVECIVDELGVDRFATFGWSGGGPFALAAAAAMRDRVTRVGVSGGLAPVLQMPGALAALTENDLLALAFLPAEPGRAAEQFLSGNEKLLDALMSVRDDQSAPWIDWMWGSSDSQVIADPAARQAIFVSFQEALRQGPKAVAWDNVAFVGPWGFDLANVIAPVHLWYGDRDEMVPPINGEWLARNLSNADLVVYKEEGHLLPLRHWGEMLQAVRP